VDVRAIPVDGLRAIVGSLAPWLQQLALGVDDRPVEPNRQAKSASSENTFNRDLTDLDEIRAAVDEMARDVAGWLGRKQQRARTVTVKVRYDDFATITRSVTVLPPTEDAELIAARAVSLLDRTEAGRRPVRLLGVGVHNLSGLDDEPPAPRPSPMPRLPFEDGDRS
jgi:DNA polymerase-4